MRVVLDYKFASLNDIINVSRTNRFMANKLKKDEMEVVRYSTIGIPAIENYPVEIVFLWHIKNINSDLDGRVEKNILDGLVNVGILKNDSLKYISKITHEYIKDTKDYVEVYIEEKSKS